MVTPFTSLLRGDVARTNTGRPVDASPLARLPYPSSTIVRAMFGGM